MKSINKWIFVLTLTVLGLWCITKVYAQSSWLGVIEVNFCNNNQKNRELDLITKAGNTTPICVEFTNKSKNSISINAEFLDSTITADTLQERDCNAADRPKTQFGNFLLPYIWETILPPNETIQKEYAIKYPVGFSWLSHGCLAYNIIWEDMKDNNMFTIRVRVVKYIDVFVSNGKVIQVVKMSPNPTIQKEWDEYTITIAMVNKGNVDEKITITSTLSNILGYKKNISFDAVIPANTWITLTTKSFIPPTYGGPFLLSSKIAYTPQFNFNITDGKQPSEIYSWGTINIQNLLFIWTRQLWVTIGILIGCAYLLIKRIL